MDRTRNDSQDTWRGASGAEDIEVLHGRSPHASKRWLGAGLLIGAVLLCGVVFVSVPNPKAINSVHGGAIRCVDNTACVGMGLVGDCCPDAHGQSQSCCHDPLNVATVTTTRRGACDDNSACAALKLQGRLLPGQFRKFPRVLQIIKQHGARTPRRRRLLRQEHGLSSHRFDGRRLLPDG